MNNYLEILKQKQIVHNFDVLINLSSSLSGFSKFLCLKLNSSIINYSSFSFSRMFNKKKSYYPYITKQLVKLKFDYERGKVVPLERGLGLGGLASSGAIY